MPLDVFQDPAGIGWCLGIVVLAQKPQATRPVFIYQRVNILHHRFFILIHYGPSLTRLGAPHKPRAIFDALSLTLLRTLCGEDARAPGNAPDYRAMTFPMFRSRSSLLKASRSVLTT